MLHVQSTQVPVQMEWVDILLTEGVLTKLVRIKAEFF